MECDPEDAVFKDPKLMAAKLVTTEANIMAILLQLEATLKTLGYKGQDVAVTVLALQTRLTTAIVKGISTRHGKVDTDQAFLDVRRLIDENDDETNEAEGNYYG